MRLVKIKKRFLLIFLLVYWAIGLLITPFVGAQITGLSPLVTFTGESNNSYLGTSVSSAGDVNADGYDDVIVGAMGYNGFHGRFYIYHGGPSMDNIVDVVSSDPGTADFLGISVSSAGDVNADGYDDVIVGAHFFDSVRGRAYIYYGGPSMDSIADVTFTGLSKGDYFGNSTSGAGDVNNDGYDDVVVGAYAASSGDGQAYIYFGGGNMDNTADITITGSGGNFAKAVASGGDVNADGYDDVIMSAWGAAGGGSARGEAYLYFGGPNMDNTADITFNGIEDNDYLGSWLLAPAGDVNNDGYDDVVVSVEGANSNRGAAHIFYGGQSMDNTADVILNGFNTGDLFGFNVAPAGDVNNDGYDDVLVGAHRVDLGGTDKGQAYIYFGGANMDNTADFIVNGVYDDDVLGASTYEVGDVNGDGWKEVIISAYSFDGAGTNRGEAYLYSLNYASPSINTDDLYATNLKRPNILGTALQSGPTAISGIQWSFNNTLPGTWNSCTASDGEYNHYSEQGSCQIKSSDLDEGKQTAYFRSYDTNSVYIPSTLYAKDDFIVDNTNPLDFNLISP